MAKHRDFNLICRTDGIGGYRKGDRIDDAAEVDAHRNGEHKHHFIQVRAPKPVQAPKPAPAAAALLETATKK